MAFVNRFALLPVSDSEGEETPQKVVPVAAKPDDKPVKGKKTEKKEEGGRGGRGAGRGRGRGAGRGRGRGGDDDRPPRQRRERGDRGRGGGRGRGRGGRDQGGERPKEDKWEAEPAVEGQTSTNASWGTNADEAKPFGGNDAPKSSWTNKKFEEPVESEEEEEQEPTFSLQEYRAQQALKRAALNEKLGTKSDEVAEEAAEEVSAAPTKKTKKGKNALLMEQMFVLDDGGRGRGRGGRGGRGRGRGRGRDNQAPSIDSSAFPALG